MDRYERLTAVPRRELLPFRGQRSGAVASVGGRIHVALQRAAAVLEGEFPDDRCADSDVASVSADFFPRARITRCGFRRAGGLPLVSAAGHLHDSGAAYYRS